ncbi:hypothetical protein D3C81_1248860 [compost metagenome]
MADGSVDTNGKGTYNFQICAQGGSKTGLAQALPGFQWKLDDRRAAQDAMDSQLRAN